MVVEFKEVEAKRTHKFKLIVEKRQEMILSIQKQNKHIKVVQKQDQDPILSPTTFDPTPQKKKDKSSALTTYKTWQREIYMAIMQGTYKPENFVTQVQANVCSYHGTTGKSYPTSQCKTILNIFTKGKAHGLTFPTLNVTTPNQFHQSQ